MIRHRTSKLMLIAIMMIATCGLASTAMAATTPSNGLAPDHVSAHTLTATAAGPPYWSDRHQFHVTDRCGGVNGWVQWYDVYSNTHYMQVYGEVWENPAACGGSGYHYVQLAWTDPPPHQDVWRSYQNGGIAYPGQTAGFNSGVIKYTSFFSIGNVVVWLCSTEGNAGCNAYKEF